MGTLVLSAETAIEVQQIWFDQALEWFFRDHFQQTLIFWVRFCWKTNPANKSLDWIFTGCWLDLGQDAPGGSWRVYFWSILLNQRFSMGSGKTSDWKTMDWFSWILDTLLNSGNDAIPRLLGSLGLAVCTETVAHNLASFQKNVSNVSQFEDGFFPA